jgi:hypothetical protein
MKNRFDKTEVKTRCEKVQILHGNVSGINALFGDSGIKSDEMHIYKKRQPLSRLPLCI